MREYGSLKLTALGHALNSGEVEFVYRELSVEEKKGRRQDPIKLEQSDLNGLDVNLLKELKNTSLKTCQSSKSTSLRSFHR